MKKFHAARYDRTAMVDHLVLAIQRLVDRFARWVRLGRPAEVVQRRFLIISNRDAAASHFQRTA